MPRTRPVVRTSAELVHAAADELGRRSWECVAVVGLTDGRVEDVRTVDLAAGESPVLAAIEALLQASSAVAMVVFTAGRPPQWVVQPCYLLREVQLVAGQPPPSRTRGTPRSSGRVTRL